MASRLQQIEADESVLLRVTHANLKSFTSDVRFSLQVSPFPQRSNVLLLFVASISDSPLWVLSKIGVVYLQLQMSIESVKEELWKKCGTSVNSMCLELYDDSGAKISDLTDNSSPFGFYSPLDGYFFFHLISMDSLLIYIPLLMRNQKLIEWLM